MLEIRFVPMLLDQFFHMGVDVEDKDVSTETDGQEEVSPSWNSARRQKRDSQPRNLRLRLHHRHCR